MSPLPASAEPEPAGVVTDTVLKTIQCETNPFDVLSTITSHQDHFVVVVAHLSSALLLVDAVVAGAGQTALKH